MITRRVKITGLELPRVLLFLVTSSVGWMVIGISLLVGGLAWGLASHQVTYVRGGQGPYHAFLSKDNSFLVFQQGGSTNYYIMRISDYTPLVATSTILSDMDASNALTFIASSDEMVVNFQIDNGAFVPNARPIEKITFFDPNGQKLTTYTSAEYSGNPNGYTINNWPYARLVIVAGAVWTSMALLFMFLGRRRRKLAKAAELEALKAMPSPFSRELGETPF